MILVADAAAVGAFLLHDEAGPFADFARASVDAHDVRVPAIWPTELASLITVAHLRGRLSDVQRNDAALQGQALLAGVTIAADPPIADIVRRARETTLSAYDATYLLLAERTGGAIITGDGRLKRAAKAVGVPVLEP